MIFIYSLILFMFGIAIGSFANVLTLRYQPERNVFSKSVIGGRSHCMHCGKTLAWYELIPLFSFLLQGGRCRSCKALLTLQYPLLEFFGGVVTLVVPLFLNAFYGVSNQFFFALELPWWYYAIVATWVLVFLLFLIITVIDLKHYIIPNEINIILFVLGIILFALSFVEKGAVLLPFRDSFVRQYILLFSPIENPAVNRVAGMLVGGFFFWMLSAVTKGRGIGFGDVKLAFVAGLVFGWPDIALAIMLSFVIGGIWSAGLVLFGSKTMRDKVPFAPFFVVGASLTFFFGYSIMKGYFGVFGL